MKKFLLIFALVLLAACDLRQKIVDAPANIGDFIAARYPALLSNPDSEIYEYASVLDYGGTTDAGEYMSYGDTSDYVSYSETGEYVSYEDSSDYEFPAQQVQTISSVSKDYGTLVVAEKKSFVLKSKEVVVQKGDTAYSIAKKHNMPVERLGILNNIRSPYKLSIGQRLRVEKAEIVTTKTEITKSDMDMSKSKIAVQNVKKQTPVIRSSPAIKLPQLQSRSSSKFSWPVLGTVISEFGPKGTGLTNDGINIKAREGSVVSSSDNGVVAYAGNELKGMGNLLIIQHSGGWMTVYAHLDSFIVRRGDRVKVGQKIGTVGQTGRVDEPQLHFEIRKGAKALNPKKYLK